MERYAVPEEANPEQKAWNDLIAVQDQIVSANCVKIHCPYCGKWNWKRHRTMCCDALRKAIVAILSGRRALMIAHAAERAQQN